MKTEPSLSVEELSSNNINNNQFSREKFLMESGPAKVEPQPEENVSGAGTSTREQNAENDAAIDEHGLEAGSDQSEDNEFEEENDSMNAEEFPELPNVEGLVQNRKLLVQVLLPCKDFLNVLSIRAKPKMISRKTKGCLMAFRIAGKEKKNSEVIVDEIVSVKKCVQTEPSEVQFKLLGQAVNISRLIAVDESEAITDQVFDLWLQHLTIRNEPLPGVQDKYKRKAHALAHLQIRSEKTEQQKNRHMAQLLANNDNNNAEWAQQIVGSSGGKLPDIARITVTSKQVQLLANNLEMVELNRVLVDCFVNVNMREYVLELEKQPKMRRHFVVPIMRVVDAQKTKTHMQKIVRTTSKLLIYFDGRIPIRHYKTGQQLNAVELPNVWNNKLHSAHRSVVQSLLMMRELNIPWPSDAEVARKSAQLDDALIRAGDREHQQAVSSSHSAPQHQQLPPGPSAATKMPRAAHRQPVQHQHSGGFFGHPPPPLAAPTPPFFFNHYHGGPSAVDGGGSQQVTQHQQQNRRRTAPDTGGRGIKEEQYGNKRHRNNLR